MHNQREKKVNKIYELGFNTYQLHASFTITSHDNILNLFKREKFSAFTQLQQD